MRGSDRSSVGVLGPSASGDAGRCYVLSHRAPRPIDWPRHTARRHAPRNATRGDQPRTAKATTPATHATAMTLPLSSLPRSQPRSCLPPSLPSLPRGQRPKSVVARAHAFPLNRPPRRGDQAIRACASPRAELPCVSVLAGGAALGHPMRCVDCTAVQYCTAVVSVTVAVIRRSTDLPRLQCTADARCQPVSARGRSPLHPVVCGRRAPHTHAYWWSIRWIVVRRKAVARRSSGPCPSSLSLPFPCSCYRIPSPRLRYTV